MSTELDRRAAAAAAAVRAAVADFEAPGSPPSPSRRRWPALVAAAVLLAGALGGALALQDDGGDTVVAGSLDEAGLPHLVVGDVPEGLTATGAAELPVRDALSGELRLRLYGRGDGDDPVGDGDLALVLASGEGWSATAEGRRVAVRGVEGRLDDDSFLGLKVLSWDEPGVGAASLVTRSLTDDELLERAERLRRSGDGLEVSPPEGYRLVADLDHFPGFAVVMSTLAGTRGSFVGYQAEDQARSLSVGSIPEEPGLLAAHRWIGGPQARRITVRGHEGWLVPASDDPQLDGLSVAWLERPGVLVDVSGVGLSEDELLQAAESVRPATDEEWADLLARAEAEDEDGRTLAGAESWRYSRDADDGVCFEVVREDGASGACSAPGALDDPRLYEGAEDADGGWWLHGRVPDEARTVVVQPEDSDPVVVDTVALDGGGRAWAALLPAPVGTVTITARTADDAEVDTASVTPALGWDGSAPGSTTTTGP